MPDRAFRQRRSRRRGVSRNSITSRRHQPYDLHESDHELENLLDDEERDRRSDTESSDEAEIEEEKVIPQPQPLAPKIKRSTRFLDGLRGVAALCVFNNHTIGGGPHERGFGDPEGPNDFISLPFVRVFYNGGASAVSIFFVLSGFVVTQTMVKLLSSDQQRNFIKSWASAMIRRPIRLYFPCWGVSLVIAFLLHLPNDIYPAVPWLAAEENLGKELLRWADRSWDYFWPLRYHASDQFWYIYDLVVWTIPIELKGSFLCYGLVAVYGLATRSFGLDSPIHIWSIGSLMVFVGVLLQYGYWWQACFTTGYVLSIMDVHELDKPLLDRSFTVTIRERRIIIPATTIALHFLLILGWYLLSEPATAGKPEWSFATPGWYWLSSMIPEAYNKDQFYRFWESWGAIAFVYATLRIGWLQWVFGTRPLQYLGRVSFMLYLVHLPVAYCFSDRWVRVFGHVPFGSEPKWWDNVLWVPEWGLGKGFNLRWALGWTTVLAVDLCVAHLFTKLLDEPCVKLGKWITGLMRLNPPAKTSIKLEDTAPTSSTVVFEQACSSSQGPILPR